MFNPFFITKELKVSAAAAGANEQDSWVNETGTKLKVESVALIPDATSAADGTNYATLTVAVDGTAIGTRATSADPLTIDTRVEMTLTGTGTELEIPINGKLRLRKTYAASGVAVNCKAVVKLSAMRS